MRISFFLETNVRRSFYLLALGTRLRLLRSPRFPPPATLWFCLPSERWEKAGLTGGMDCGGGCGGGGVPAALLAEEPAEDVELLAASAPAKVVLT